MMAFLNFTFQSVWHFLGVLALIYVAFTGIAAIVSAAMSKGKQ